MTWLEKLVTLIKRDTLSADKVTQTITLGIDTSPTEDSNNLVTSGGVYGALDDKVDKIAGKGLSTNDFTNTYKSMLDELGNMTTDDIDDIWDEVMI